jgi:hypothetical protein
MSHKPPKIIVKRGDNFRLDMTAQDTNSDAAIAQAIVVAEAQNAYNQALAAVPQVPATVASTQAALLAAQVSYNSIILIDITTWVITSKMAWAGKLITTFTVTIEDGPNGVFSIQAVPAQTDLWKPRTYEADVQFYRDSLKVSSQTFMIQVERDITNG